MQKYKSKLATVVIIVIGILVVTMTFILLEWANNNLATKIELNQQQDQINTLRADIQTIKESLDTKGFKDLNL